MDWNQINDAWIVIAAFLGGLILLDNAMDRIKKHKQPTQDIEETLRRHGQMLDSDQKRITALEENMRDTTRVQNRALLNIIKHGIDGDSQHLKDARDEVENYLINH